MKIERGKANYTLGYPVGLAQAIALDEGAEEMRGAIYALHLVPFREIAARRGKEDKPFLGRPVMVSIDDMTNVSLWPTPDKDANLIVRGYGPSFEQ